MGRRRKNATSSMFELNHMMAAPFSNGDFCCQCYSRQYACSALPFTSNDY